VLEFVKLKGLYLGEELAGIVKKLLGELKLKPKLFVITRDNASNNSTLCQSLFNSLYRKYNNKFSPIRRPQMHFHGHQSWIRYLAHIVSLVCTDVLKDLKSSSAKEANKALDS